MEYKLKTTRSKSDAFDSSGIDDGKPLFGFLEFTGKAYRHGNRPLIVSERGTFMNALLRWFPLLLALIFAAPHELQADQKGKSNKNKKNDERRENEAVHKAQQDVKAAQEAEQKAERSLKQALAEVKSGERDQQQAANQLQKVRKELEAKHADLSGWTEKRKKADAVREAYEAAGQPVLTRLKTTDEYKRAVDAAKTADNRLAALREQTGDETDDRRKQLAEIARIKLVPSQLERAALDSESSLNDERRKLAAAEEAVADAHKAMELAIENDPAIKSATRAFTKAKDSLVALRTAAAKEERQLAEARQKLAREKQDLQKKIAADKRDGK